MFKSNIMSTMAVYRLKQLNHGKDVYFDVGDNEQLSEIVSINVEKYGFTLVAVRNSMVLIRWDGNLVKLKLERVY